MQPITRIGNQQELPNRSCLVGTLLERQQVARNAYGRTRKVLQQPIGPEVFIAESIKSRPVQDLNVLSVAGVRERAITQAGAGTGQHYNDCPDRWYTNHQKNDRERFPVRGSTKSNALATAPLSSHDGWSKPGPDQCKVYRVGGSNT